MQRIATIGAVQRHIRSYGTNKTTYTGDGTKSLTDSYRALWTDMVKRGYPPETTRLLH